MSRKKLLLILSVFIGIGLFASGMQMKMFQSVSRDKSVILQKGDAKMFCVKCGMSLPMFFKTNHAADVNDKTRQYCSLHCVVEDKEIDKNDLKNIQVVDVQTLKFIPVEKAYYVVGSDVKGTMTMTSKYAFGTKEGALKFVKEHGGKIMRFDEAYEAAKKDFECDCVVISKKKKKMIKKGEMIYKKRCKSTEKKFDSTAEAKAFIVKNGLCEGLNPKQLQAVGLYLSE